MEDPAEAKFHSVINAERVLQQPGEECCSETLELSVKVSKRKYTHCCKSYFLVNGI